MRILLVCERMGARDDEGIRNLARSLAGRLSAGHTLLTITQAPADASVGVGGIGRAAARGGGSRPPHIPPGALVRRTFVSRRLLAQCAEFRPDVTLYIPWTSGTLPTFFRGRVLRLATRAPLAIYLTQPYDNPRWQRGLIRYMLPDLVLALSETVVRHVAQMGAHAELAPPGVDLARFDLPDPSLRAALRARLGLRPRDQMVLHVGHLNRQRLDHAELGALAARPGRRVMVVASTSTPQDAALERALVRAGCTVLTEYVPHIETLYKAADAYLFPTREQRSSIGVPLSVLEALACGVPVVSTRFEGLPRLFPGSPSLRFFGTSLQAERALDDLPRAPDPAARALVRALDWSDVAERVEQHLASLATVRDATAARSEEPSPRGTRDESG